MHMIMTNTPRQIGSTLHAYRLIRVNITTQKGNMRQNIINAKRYGIVHPDETIPKSISKFVGWVKYHYRTTTTKPDFTQIYSVYGNFLYIFTRDKKKLISIYHLPPGCLEDAKALAKSRNPRYEKKANKSKLSILERPLTIPKPTKVFKKKSKPKHKTKFKKAISK